MLPPFVVEEFPSFISCNVSVSGFRCVRVIVPQSMLDRHEKEVLLLDTVGTWKELVSALRKTLAVICTIVENLAFFLI